MLQYVFCKPIPVEELEAELRSFARLVAHDGYDTISSMVVIVEPTRCGEPFELRRPNSDIPTIRIIFESRVAGMKLGKPAIKSARAQDRAGGDD